MTAMTVLIAGNPTCAMRVQVFRPHGAGPARGRAILQQRCHDAHKLVKAHARIVVGVHLVRAGVCGAACCCRSLEGVATGGWQGDLWVYGDDVCLPNVQALFHPGGQNVHGRIGPKGL